jgi:hypothetical protein
VCVGEPWIFSVSLTFVLIFHLVLFLKSRVRDFIISVVWPTFGCSAREFNELTRDRKKISRKGKKKHITQMENWLAKRNGIIQAECLRTMRNSPKVKTKVKLHC